MMQLIRATSSMDVLEVRSQAEDIPSRATRRVCPERRMELRRLARCFEEGHWQTTVARRMEEAVVSGCHCVSHCSLPLAASIKIAAN